MQTIQSFARRSTAVALCGSVLALSASASDFNVTVSSNGTSAVTVQPGDPVPYSIVGELSDNASQGLAMFAIDLAFDGGDLDQANAPVAGAMLNFASPLGINNPAGFNGTPIDGDLIQIGGAQNTINNMFAPQPSGMVTTGVGLPGSPEVLVTGMLTAPTAPGTYTLAVSNVMANAIDSATTGFPFWEVDAVEEGAITQLTITVEDCSVSLYCQGKANSLGCVPTLEYQGTPTLTGPNDFRIVARNVLNQQFGLMFWSLEDNDLPLLGGTLCVGFNLNRMETKLTSGAGAPGSNCNGVFPQIFSQAVMNSNGLTAGTEVFTQFYYRDPAIADGTGAVLSGGIRFTICP